MSWYLQKNDGETYGPVEMDELQHWAAEGRIAPQDKLSQDNKHWAAAPDAAVKSQSSVHSWSFTKVIYS